MSDSPSNNPWGRTWLFRALLLLAVLLVGIAAGLLLNQFTSGGDLDPTLAAFATQMYQPATPSATIGAIFEPDEAAAVAPELSGSLFFTQRVGGHDQIFLYVPGNSEPRLVAGGAYDSRDPALSPDGHTLAFTSDRAGAFDLYLLDLRDGALRQLTQTLEYEGHPTWSPDGLWLAFEAHYQGDFDIWILPVDGSQTPIMLTDNAGLDFAPSWDPNGRKIAFVSDRDGSMDIFLADLDRPTDRFINLTQTSTIDEADPAFSPDGSQLLYSSMPAGLDMLIVISLDGENQEPRIIGQGRDGVWSPDSGMVLANLTAPQHTQLFIYTINRSSLTSGGLPFVENVADVFWSPHVLSESLLTAMPLLDDTPLYEVELDTQPEEDGRLNLSELAGVNAPHPLLSDAVDEAFQALRERVMQEAGWDFLGQLENAFVGINEPLPPGYAYNDWLYTGRAFSFSSSALEAGWVEVVPEAYGGQVYWRIYVRTANQEGLQGEPMRVRPWDFNSRYADDPYAYDRGGTTKNTIPAGYYLDFTALALDFGFERLSALSNWRTFFPGARFNEFVLRDSLTWEEAMLQLYPRSAIVTPTPYRTPTPTPTQTPRPTPTPWWWRWRTPTPGPTPAPPMATPTESP